MSSIKLVPKAFGLRISCACSSDNDRAAKSKKYTKYLVNRRHNLKLVQRRFNNVCKTSRQETQKKVKPRNASNLVSNKTEKNLQ